MTLHCCPICGASTAAPCVHLLRLLDAIDTPAEQAVIDRFERGPECHCGDPDYPHWHIVPKRPQRAGEER